VLDVHEPEKDELTADDFKKLRAKKEVKKEEVEPVDEAMRPGFTHQDAAEARRRKEQTLANNPNIAAEVERRRKATEDAKKQPVKEDIEQIVEYETNKDGKFVHNAKAGRYGGSEKPQDPFAGVRGPGQKDLEKIEAEKKKKQKKFSEMVNLYQEKGLKSLSEMLVKEEPDNEQFTKELEDAKAKSEGKKKNTEIAKGSVQAVKNEELDINAINGVQMSSIEERMMTEPEKEKKEDIVKGMKKGMAGFKERYGSRANDVMYATATKQAMK
jgi:hypothetical protein